MPALVAVGTLRRRGCRAGAIRDSSGLVLCSELRKRHNSLEARKIRAFLHGRAHGCDRCSWRAVRDGAAAAPCGETHGGTRFERSHATPSREGPSKNSCTDGKAVRSLRLVRSISWRTLNVSQSRLRANEVSLDQDKSKWLDSHLSWAESTCRLDSSFCA